MVERTYTGTKFNIAPPRRRMRYCRWENIMMKRCPACLEWLRRTIEGHMACKNDKCEFVRSVDEIKASLEDRDGLFTKFLDLDDLRKIKGALHELKIMV